MQYTSRYEKGKEATVHSAKLFFRVVALYIETRRSKTLFAQAAAMFTMKIFKPVKHTTNRNFSRFTYVNATIPLHS